MKLRWSHLFLLPLTCLVEAYCPPTGPVLPPPNISSHGNLTTSLEQTIRKLAETDGLWNKTTTSFSIELTSREKTVFCFHHTAPLLNTSGVERVNGETVYRVASVTKVFTVLALLLQQDFNLDDPVAYYVPELRGIGRYKDVTLRMLASQLGGVHREGYTFDLAMTNAPEDLHALGFPDVPLPPQVPVCDTLVAPLCSRSQFLKDLSNHDFVWQPGQRAAYSNQGFILLGLALENMTNTSYDDFISKQIIEPLGISSATGFTLQNLSSAAIPVDGGSQWINLPLGQNDASAGLYATPDDLARFLRGILNHKLISAPKTDLWLKPATFTSSSNSAVGMSWEILRAELAPESRLVDVYTKSGNMPFYAANIALIPAYDVGVVINAAGADSYTAARVLLDKVVVSAVQELEELARAQAQKKYAGRYTLSNDSSLVLVVDKGPGLKVKEWTSHGKSVLEAWRQLRAETAAGVDARLYPVGIDDRWRVTFEAIPEEKKTGLFKDACEAWFTVDQFRYQGLPVDEIVFDVQDGIVKGLGVAGLRQNLTKI